MKIKYTDQELEDALNSIDASHETKRTIEKDLRRNDGSMILSYFILSFGILIFVLPFASLFIGIERTSDTRTGEQVLFWFGLFLITIARYQIHRIRMRRAVVELMMKYNRATQRVDLTR